MAERVKTKSPTATTNETNPRGTSCLRTYLARYLVRESPRTYSVLILVLAIFALVRVAQQRSANTVECGISNSGDASHLLLVVVEQEIGVLAMHFGRRDVAQLLHVGSTTHLEL